MTDLETLFAQIREGTDRALQRIVDESPNSMECATHPNHTAVLNEEATLASGKAVYRCPACIGDKVAMRRERKLINVGIPRDVRHAT